MRWTLVGVLAGCLVTGLVGCGALDWVFGVQVDPQTGDVTTPPGGAGGPQTPAGTAGGILSWWFPWATNAITLIGGVYADLRRRKYLSALTSVVKGVEDAFDANRDGVITTEELKEALQRAQQHKGTQPVVQQILNLVQRQD